MPDKFDPYREALVVETSTVWPDDCDELKPPEKRQTEQQLHADPSACTHLDYLRVHSGFCRQITVTREDLARLRT